RAVATFSPRPGDVREPPRAGFCPAIGSSRTGRDPMTDTRLGPLAGVRVLDLTEHMAGPYCTMILGDMGAEVIKVERPGGGDSSRAMGDGTPRNPYFRYINRNKKSLTLDYKPPRGRAIFLALADRADVLVENYRPTVMDRAGLGYEALAARN